jgi:hypothetical protein
MDFAHITPTSVVLLLLYILFLKFNILSTFSRILIVFEYSWNIRVLSYFCVSLIQFLFVSEDFFFLYYNSILFLFLGDLIFSM